MTLGCRSYRFCAAFLRILENPGQNETDDLVAKAVATETTHVENRVPNNMLSKDMFKSPRTPIRGLPHWESNQAKFHKRLQNIGVGICFVSFLFRLDK